LVWIWNSEPCFLIIWLFSWNDWILTQEYAKWQVEIPSDLWQNGWIVEPIVHLHWLQGIQDDFLEAQPFLRQLLPNWKKTVCYIPSQVQVSKASLGLEALNLKCYQSIGPGAYNVEEVRWCNATYDILVSHLDDEGRAKRSIPLRTRRPAAGRLQAAPAAA
jgi:hypothetical protein